MKLTPRLYFALGLIWISAFFFILAAFSDFVYSDCIYIGTPAVSCISNAKILYPLVGSTGLILNSADIMGRVGGISFLWLFAGFFLLKAGKDGMTTLKAFAGALASISVVYWFFMLGVVLFIPYCLVGSCRISNEIPWFNYIQGFYIATIIFSSYVLIRVWTWILNERKRILRNKILGIS